jgi:hypothetical protein
MMRYLGSVLAAFISLSMWPIWAAAASIAIETASASSMAGDEFPPIHQYSVRHSHKFYMEPRALISTILSDVRRQPIIQNDDGTSSLLDIDVSSTRLGDNAAGSLMEELMPLLKTKINHVDEDQARAPLLVRLRIATNIITPPGASKVIDTLMKGDAKNGGTIPVEDGNVDEIKNSNGMGIGSSSLVVNGLNNETTEQTIHLATSDGRTSNFTSTTQVVEKPSILIEELDLSFNDIGGHGVHSPNAQLQDSIRRLFEGEGSGFAPRLLTLENCGIGPSFCRSVGRVSKDAIRYCML